MEEMPPGYRFYPTEEELVSFYLRKKLQGGRNDLHRVIPVVDIFEHEPCQLPKVSGELCQRDMEQWFFFVPRQERVARGGRPSRTTASGYWKATGSPSYVYSSDNRVIGMQKTMVFYKGKAPSGRKTKWKMNEYKAIDQETSTPLGYAVPKLRHEVSICRVYVIQGSFRAFDRRPLGRRSESLSQQNQIVQGHEATAVTAPSQCSQATETGEKSSSSPESWYSGEDHFKPQQTNSGNVDGQGQPLWEWEQLNWL